MSKLNDKQKLFAQEYVKSGFDLRASAINAGYSAKSAGSLASRLVRKPQVKAEIDRLMVQVEERCTVTAAEIVSTLRKIAFAPWSERINATDRLRALELLGRYLAMFTDNVCSTGEGLHINVSTKEDQPALPNIKLVKGENAG